MAGVAGYVHGASGRRYVLVAIVNHANADAARPALEALIDWAIDDAGDIRQPADQRTGGIQNGLFCERE